MKTILVLGATGGIGGAVTRVMLNRGWQVRAMVRDPTRAASGWGHSVMPHWVQGDAMQRDDVVNAASEAVAILHGVNPPGYRAWETTVLPMMDNTIAAARSVGGARIVLPGTIYNYDATTTPVIDETTPQNPTSRKGKIRKALERRLADGASDCPSLIVRAGDYFGAGARQSWFAQALAKAPLKQITYPGRTGIGHAWAYLPDLAETIAQLLELPPGAMATAERVQFCGFWDADGTHMITALRRMMGRPNLPVRHFPWWLMRLLSPFGGFPREVIEVKPYWHYPVRLDNSRLIRLLGTEPHTALDQAVRDAVGWPRTSTS
ncbi:nucleoside-diphosphate-sugar epimerase [Acetobacter aceti NBRC 14818]|uniref:Epimerase n=1 Tax=Acetobacter aceti NBRC 14818 TaxID=887700 RepID=A0AB33ILS6_ACEAC|nr:NAD(P)H-binding protein [Acetobacter aceti]TCS31433.1 nucleoside-diphosphate-sugar epimerase [Acetobacter aceti NBRC 14818]BCK76812.1 epimerase [Acetobacter aceti NBRC 14818]GAN56915.1 NAD dependent epimerase/dehydratase [Acetobacter aceti NBRC 14818]